MSHPTSDQPHPNRSRPNTAAAETVQVGASRYGTNGPKKISPLLRSVPDLAPAPDPSTEPNVQAGPSLQTEPAAHPAAEQDTTPKQDTAPGTKTTPAQDTAPAQQTDTLQPGTDRYDQVLAALEFLHRRCTGDFEVDEFGFDEDFTNSAVLHMLRVLYRSWFRVQVRGIENIPTTGGALVVANHSGMIALDSLMTVVAIHDEHPANRQLRMLGADLLFKTPILASLARKVGTTLANRDDAERLLRAGHVVGVWPEGFKGTGKHFSDRYKLQRFGRGGFVSAAITAGVPIIPCSIVGAEETYPIIGDVKLLARVFGVPYWPITPTWPLLGPAGLLPLPSKWLIEFGEPIDTTQYTDTGPPDPMAVFDMMDNVRETIQETLYALLVERGNAYW